jgi:hypothetical protein
MHDECVAPDAADLAHALADTAARHELALGGGTACALRLGHRVSRDLDFFALRPLDPTALLDASAGLDRQRPRGISHTELVVVPNGVQVSATSLGREPLAPTEPWSELVVLSALDLAELKVVASVRRGMLRDLCDLHLLCLAGTDLEVAVRASEIDLVVAVKALTDAERFRGQPELELRRAWNADGALAYFTAEARRLLG